MLRRVPRGSSTIFEVKSLQSVPTRTRVSAGPRGPPPIEGPSYAARQIYFVDGSSQQFVKDLGGD